MTIHKNYDIEANTTKGEEDVRQIETLGWRRYVQNNLFSSFVLWEVDRYPWLAKICPE
jgi:hypothetical protein